MDATTLRIFDVQEKATGEVKAPSFPAPTQSSTGFPEHKKRTRTSAFKQRKQSEQASQTSTALPGSHKAPEHDGQDKGPSRLGFSSAESKKIDQENKSRIENMSPEEIEAAQREIFNSLDPSLVQRLFQRANLDEAGPSPFTTTSDNDALGAVAVPNSTSKPPEPTASDRPSPPKDSGKPKKRVTFDQDAAPPAPDQSDPSLPATNTTHFPRQNIPDLHPDDPDFLENLHKKFFPNLPADPSKLAWMAPLPTPNSTADRESPYHPGQDSLPVSALRFDFKGLLIPPRLSRQIPVTHGLHHHGVAPEAAGYTIPELARLARSAVPGQRCIAFQTLGRMLFRLGKGEWGIGEGGRVGEEDDLAFGLWRCFLETRVIDSLLEAASVEDGAGHMASKAYAVEALWLFEKGEWKEKWRGL